MTNKDTTSLMALFGLLVDAISALKMVKVEGKELSEETRVAVDLALESFKEELGEEWLE